MAELLFFIWLTGFVGVWIGKFLKLKLFGIKIYYSGVICASTTIFLSLFFMYDIFEDLDRLKSKRIYEQNKN